VGGGGGGGGAQARVMDTNSVVVPAFPWNKHQSDTPLIWTSLMRAPLNRAALTVTVSVAKYMTCVYAHHLQQHWKVCISRRKSSSGSSRDQMMV
jgi:hypothetical protein